VAVNKIQDRAHHSIMLVLGARTPELCPKCGSTEWYIIHTYNRRDKCYSDGSTEEGDLDYDSSFEQCYDCNHDSYS